MHAAVRGVLVVLLLGTAPRVDAQTSEPLRKTDLIRLLSGGALSHREIADLIGRNCVSFTPTTRDRIDLAALGADSLMLSRIATCRRSQAARPAAPPPPASPAAAVVVPLQSRVTVEAGSEVVVAVAVRQGAQPAPGVRLVLRGSGGMSGTVGAGPDAVAVTDARGIASFRVRAASAPITRSLSVEAADGTMLTGRTGVEFITLPAAASRPVPVATTRPGGARTPRPSPTGTGWVAGTGQRGVVGRRTAVPLIFEARDSAGAPIPGLPVTLRVANGRLLSPPDHTDAAGAVWVDLEFGPRAAATTVTATLGAIVRQATFYPAPGPAARLLVLRGRDTVTRRLELDPDAASNLLVIPTDAFGNPLPVRGLLAAVGDGRVLKVLGVTTDSLGGHVTLRPGRAGGSATNLAVQASGLRTDLTASVRARRP